MPSSVHKIISFIVLFSFYKMSDIQSIKLWQKMPGQNMEKQL